jgi:hypothetical protein
VRKTYKANQLVRALEAKGFVEVKRGGDRVFEFWVDGKKILHTFLSHGRGECGAWHIGKMASQCQISRDQFRDLVDCPMSETKYISVLRQKDII